MAFLQTCWVSSVVRPLGGSLGVDITHRTARTVFPNWVVESGHLLRVSAQAKGGNTIGLGIMTWWLMKIRTDT